MRDPVWRQAWRWAIPGLVVGALDGGGIFFAPGEPYPWQIFCAAILKGLLVAALVALSLRSRTTLLRGAAVGAVYGLLNAAVVWLAKGGLVSSDPQYVLQAGLVMGVILGAWIARFGLPR
jgi:hypothetical protein